MDAKLSIVPAKLVDSLIVGAAQLQGCELILTEDFQDGGVDGDVTAPSPFTLSLNEDVASYAVSRMPLSMHPPRGRPKELWCDSRSPWAAAPEIVQFVEQNSDLGSAGPID